MRSGWYWRLAEETRHRVQPPCYQAIIDVREFLKKARRGSNIDRFGLLWNAEKFVVANPNGKLHGQCPSQEKLTDLPGTAKAVASAIGQFPTRSKRFVPGVGATMVALLRIQHVQWATLSIHIGLY